VRSVLLIANPIAGAGRAGRLADRLEAVLRTRYRVERVAERPREVDLDRFTRHAPIACVVVGGDGTIRETIERQVGLLGASNLVPILPVPFGTANLLARHLRHHAAPETVARRVAAALDRGEVRRLDAATINDKLFLLMAGVGPDAWVVHALHRTRRGPISKLSYLRPAFASLARTLPTRLTVEIDGRRVLDDRPGTVLVANLPEYGTGRPIIPDARGDDGLLDVCVWPGATPLSPGAVHAASLLGLATKLPGAIYRQAKRVTITAKTPLAIQADGDPAGHTPAALALPGWTVPFIVPSP
jgi:diacylglycerol kinase (ATP)